MSKLAQSLKVVRGYVLLEELENEKPSDFLVEDDKEIPQRGRVLVVGDHIWHDNGDVYTSPAKLGDKVIHSAYGYEKITYEGKEYRVCPFSKILAVIK